MIEKPWGKYLPDAERYPLAAHMLDTGCAALELTEHWLRPGLQDFLQEDLGPQWREIISVVAGLHDVGKANPVFQGQLAAGAEVPWAIEALKEFPSNEYARQFPREYCEKPFIRRHEQVSFLQLAGDEPFDTPAVDLWVALSALGHHGLYSPVGEKDVARFSRRFQLGWADLRGRLESWYRRAFSSAGVDLPRSVRVESVILISGLVILADRLASAGDIVAQQAARRAAGEIALNRPDEWLESSRPLMRERMKAALGVYEDLDNPSGSILGDYSPRGAQISASQMGEGLVAMMLPTGSGKTEAALLRHSARPERLAFFLPTRATTNAIMRRVQKAYAQTSNVGSLAHGLASIEDFYAQSFEDLYGAERPGEYRRKGLHPSSFTQAGSGRLLAPITVGTIDQCLMASLSLKWTHLRLLALANAHVVIDEVHTLDAYQTELLTTALDWLGRVGARVTLLSATLASAQLSQLLSAYGRTPLAVEPEFPSVIQVESASVAEPKKTAGDDGVERYEISYELTSASHSVGQSFIDEHERWISEHRRENPEARIGVFVNTVARAQELGRRLRDAGENVVVLHSLMTAAHRSQAELRLHQLLGVGGKGRGITVVGTQAIEASLDIDFDVASTDIAPAPSLLQRAGRVWRRFDGDRHLRTSTAGPYLHIVRSREAAWHLPYTTANLLRTERWLDEHGGAIRCPDDVQDFVESSWISFETMVSKQDELHLVKDLQKILSAKNAQWRFKDLDSLDYRGFCSLTSAGERGEERAGTRLNERESVSIILCGGNGTGPSEALHMSMEEARQKLRTGCRTNVIKKFLGAGLSTSSTAIVKRVKGYGDYLEGPQVPRLLRGRYLVELSEQFAYDDLLGLELLPRSPVEKKNTAP